MLKADPIHLFVLVPLLSVFTVKAQTYTVSVPANRPVATDIHVERGEEYPF